ncbi:hypothetical protein K439DRAFT_1643417 [Ramaria rubella]|nr:hypothetical protein K439DRAFT_1643417 [Ramaria rubella]
MTRSTHAEHVAEYVQTCPHVHSSHQPPTSYHGTSLSQLSPNTVSSIHPPPRKPGTLGPRPSSLRYSQVPARSSHYSIAR